MSQSIGNRLTIGLGILTGQVATGSSISFADEYRAVIDISQAAEALGFDSVWLSEHHGADDGYMPAGVANDGRHRGRHQAHKAGHRDHDSSLLSSAIPG